MTAPAPPEPPGPGALEGAGVVSSWGDFGTALGTGDGFQIAFTGAAAALDTLGFVADPFGSLVSAGVGYAIEHVAFLREPLDQLAGNPWAVAEQAKSWHAVAVELSAAAQAQLALAALAPGDWSGAAAEAHSRAARFRAELVDGVAAQVDELAVVLVDTGAMIGTARSLIRDSIADFLAGVAAKLVAGAVTAALTGGVSFAAAAGWVILDAIDLARRITERIARLLRAVADAGNAASSLAAGILETARRTRDAAVILNAGARPVDEAVGRTPAGDLVEVGKQYSAAGLEDPQAAPAEPAPATR